MPKRTAFILLVVAALLVVLLLALRRVDRQPASSPHEAAASNEVAPASTSRTQQETSVERALSKITSALGDSKEDQRRTGLALLNHVPIEYYGRVEDQEGNPLPRTKLRYSLHYNDGHREGTKTGETVADSNGNFAITGLNGKSLSVIPERDGYKFIATNGGAMYSHLWPKEQRHVPNPVTPVVLRMWKLRGPEPLLSFSRRFWLRPDIGGPTKLEVAVPGNPSSPLRLFFSVSGSFDPDRPQQGDWEWQMLTESFSVCNAGERPPEYMFEVPDNSYTNRVGVRYVMDTPGWSRRVSKLYYLKSGSGAIFGRMSLRIVADAIRDGSIPIDVDLLINPSGSRNLEIHANNVSKID